MRRAAIAALCILFLAGCAPATVPPATPAGTTVLFVPPATPRPWPTATATPLPTATPTATPTPSPTPTPPPLTGTLAVEPVQVYPGHTIVVRLTSSLPATAQAYLNGEALLLFPKWASTEHTALAGIWFWSDAGRQVISATLQDDLGRSTTLSSTIEVVPGDYPLENIQLLPGREALLDPKVLDEEWALVSPVLEEVTPRRLWEGLFITPTHGYVSSPFGVMRSYNGGPPSGYHNGLDIANITGTLVVAPARGRVVFAARLQVRGNCVILDHGWGVHSSFFHMSEILVNVGDVLDVGQPIGKIGATGLVTGPHVHWEMRVGMIAVDPQEWVRRTFP
jgi:murein DD-endopeptidase MepM/ murein hydrolase activator NlpD